MSVINSNKEVMKIFEAGDYNETDESFKIAEHKMNRLDQYSCKLFGMKCEKVENLNSNDSRVTLIFFLGEVFCEYLCKISSGTHDFF